MRNSMVAAAAGVFASTASALSYETVSTVYEYYSNCLSTQAGLATALPVGVIHNSSIFTETYCESCAEGKNIPYPSAGTNGTATSPLTTYTTVYSCPGSTGLEEKTYTITEPCPTLGQPRSAGYIPQDFTVTTVQCTACPGSPQVAVTQPATAERTEAPVGGSPGAPGSAGSPSAAGGSPGSPGSPGSAAAAPGSAGSPSVAPGSPGSPGSAASPAAAAGAPGSPGSAGAAGSPASPGAAAVAGSAGSPGAAAAPGSPSVGAENGSGATASLVAAAAASPGSAGSPGAAAAPAAPGSSSPESAGPGAPAAAGAASAPFPVSVSGESRAGGTAAPSTGASSSSVTPFEGGATEIFTISLSFLIGVGGFVGFYLMI